MTFGNTEYTKEELIALAMGIAAHQAKDWRNEDGTNEGWDHYDALYEAFKAIKAEYENK